VLLERSLGVYSELTHARAGVAAVLGDLAGLAACRGELGRAQSQCEESVGIFREVDEPRGLAAELGLLGRLAAWQGDDADALAQVSRRRPRPGQCLPLSRGGSTRFFPSQRSEYCGSPRTNNATYAPIRAPNRVSSRQKLITVSLPVAVARL
jgi:hypothetical protein